MHEALDLVPCTTSKQDVVAYTTIPELGWKKQEMQEFKSILGYIGDLRPA